MTATAVIKMHFFGAIAIHLAAQYEVEVTQSPNQQSINKSSFDYFQESLHMQ